MKTTCILVLTLCGIWMVKSDEIVLNEGIDDPIAWVIYKKQLSLSGSYQAITFPPAGYYVDDFRITKVKVTTGSNSGLTANIEDGGRGSKNVRVGVRGKSGTKFWLVITTVFESKCRKLTRVEDWSSLPR